MNSGIYTAFSGMRAQMDALDLLSNNLANLNTVGFKEGKAFFELLKQNMSESEANSLESVVNNRAVLAHGALNMTDGSAVPTERDLDISLEGSGFLTVQTPQGIRYTRNGRLLLDSHSLLSTSEGFPLLGVNGRPITLGPGKISITRTGDVSLEGTPVDRLKIVTFDHPERLVREGNSLLQSQPGQAEKAGDAVVRQGYLEQSNVNPVSAVIELVEIMRQFESIQKTLNLMMNDLNAKSIERLSR